MPHSDTTESRRGQFNVKKLSTFSTLKNLGKMLKVANKEAIESDAHKAMQKVLISAS